MTIEIDLSDMSGMIIASDALAAQDTEVTIDQNADGSFRLDSKTTRSTFLTYRIPSELPVGTRVELIVTARTISGELCQISFDSFATETYGGQSGNEGGKIQGPTADITDTSEFREVRTVTFIAPGQQFLRASVGYFLTRIGVCDIRSFRLKIDGADITRVQPQLGPSGARQAWRPDKLANTWNRFVNAGGVITDNSPANITLSASFTATATIRPGSSETLVEARKFAYYNVLGSKGMCVKTKATRLSGWPAMRVEYYALGGGSPLNEIFVYFTGKIGESVTQTMYLPPYPLADEMHLTFGFFFDQNQGAIEVEAIEACQYDAIEFSDIQGVQPIVAALLKDSGVWRLDDSNLAFGTLRPVSSNVASISVGGSDINIVFDTSAISGRPVVMAQIQAAEADAFFCTIVDLPGNDLAVVTFFDRSTRLAVTPASMPDGTHVSVIGMGVR